MNLIYLEQEKSLKNYGKLHKGETHRFMNEHFLKKLQEEAQQQQKLYNTRIIPEAFDPITSFIGENTILFLTCISVCTALLVELIKRL